jgi:FkbM family methyltransferase
MKTSLEEKIRYVNAGSSIARHLLPLQPQVIVDCGACDGLDSVRYARLFPGATVYAIEPREDNYVEIVDNIGLFSCPNIKPMKACLSDAEGCVRFFESFGDSGNKKNWDSGNKSSSIMEPTGHLAEHPWCRFNEGTVRTMRFDALNIPAVDFLHLDVQGAELKVLAGFGEALKTLKMVWLEVARIELYSGQPLVRDIEGYMLKNNFRKLTDTCSKKYGDQLWAR